MLFDELPPDTSIYMIAGYAVFFVVTVIYLGSLFIRTRNLNRDLATLEEVQKEQPAEVPAVTSAPARTRAQAGRAKTGKAKKPQKKAARKR